MIRIATGGSEQYFRKKVQFELSLKELQGLMEK